MLYYVRKEIVGMDEDRKAAIAKRKIEDKAKQQKALAEKYKERGFQRVSWMEYKTLQSKSAKKYRLLKKWKIPPHLKFILGTPFLIIFCFGLIFLPFMIYLVATGPSADSKKPTKKTTITQPADEKNSQTTSPAQRP